MIIDKLSRSQIECNTSIRALAYPSLEVKKNQINQIFLKMIGFEANYELKVENGFLMGYVAADRKFNPKWFCKILDMK